MKPMNGDELIGLPLAALDTPALLIDAGRLEANIAAMARLVEGHMIALRPHTKTHKSSIIASMQAKAGAKGFCCAKLGEAEVLAEGGIDDLMITTPLRGGIKLERLERLLRRTRLTVLVDDEEAIEPLADTAARAASVLNVVVEINVGQNRCGVLPGEAALRLAQKILPHRSLRFRGLQGYQGSIQGLRSFGERREQARRALDALLATAEIVRHAGIAIPVLTGGGTGTLVPDLAFGGLNELQPGSYVLMDASYLTIEWNDSGAPPPFMPALTLLTSVVSRPASDRVIVDIGWKAASSDSGPPAIKDRPDLAFAFAGDEHGRITGNNGTASDLRPGDKIELIPSHCDTTVNLHDHYLVHRNGCVEAVWRVEARGRSD